VLQNYELFVTTPDAVEEWNDKEAAARGGMQKQTIYMYQYTNDSKFYYVYIHPETNNIVQSGPIESFDYYSGSFANFNKLLTCATNDYYNARSMLYLINELVKQEIQKQYIAKQVEEKTDDAELTNLYYLELMPDDLSMPDIHTIYLKSQYDLCVLGSISMPVLEQGKIYLKPDQTHDKLEYVVCDYEGHNHQGSLLLSELGIDKQQTINENSLLALNTDILNLIALQLKEQGKQALSLSLNKFKYAVVDLNNQLEPLKQGELDNKDVDQQQLQKSLQLSKNMRNLDKQIKSLKQELSLPVYVDFIAYKNALVKSVAQKHNLMLADQSGKNIDYDIQLKQNNQTIFEKNIIYFVG